MQGRVKIPPSRAVATYALLTVFSIVASYVFLLLLAAACIYLPYLACTSSIHLVLQAWILALASVVVGFALLWSMIPRRDKFDPPGLRLEPHSQPKLFDEIHGVAAALGEPVPGEVYLVGNPNAFVADRGGVLGFGSRRVMAIGLPLLSLLTVSELRATLAHEFAHFYSGDTSLGPWIYRTRTAFARTFQNVEGLRQIGRIGFAGVLFALVGHVLLWYFRWFLRVTNFISRKQEFRSDELGRIIAGKQAMIRTLEKIHGAGFFWDIYWQCEVSPIVQENFLPPIGEGFVRFVESPEISELVSEFLKKETETPTVDPYDSHPPYAERLAALESMEEDESPLDARPGVSLLQEPATLEMRFVEHMNANFVNGRLRFVAWNEVAEQVLVPRWKREVAFFSSVLTGKTIEDVPDLAENLARMGARAPDPKGILLSPAQRAQRAANALGFAVGLLLLEQGWTLEATPGHLELKQGPQGIKPGEPINNLVTKKLSRGGWNEQCRAWGIAGMQLWAVAPGTRQE